MGGRDNIGFDGSRRGGPKSLRDLTAKRKRGMYSRRGRVAIPISGRKAVVGHSQSANQTARRELLFIAPRGGVRLDVTATQVSR